MKKITTLLLLCSISLIGLSSCSSDDNTPVVQPEEENHLLGTWRLATMSVKSYENDELVSEYTDLPVSSTIQWEYTFNNDNTVEYLMAIPAAELSESGSGTYVRNGNILTMTIVGEDGVFEITELASESFNIKFEEEYSVEGVSYRDEIEQKFTR